MTEINFDAARENMIAQQIRTWEVLDERVLELIRRTPREDYVPPQYRKLAFADVNLPLGHGQVMTTPKLEARMLQALEIQPGDRILEVGTGSGYTTALLAGLGGHVYSVEIIPELKEQAEGKLAAHGVNNVTLEVGDAARGWDRHGPYDVILITGSLPLLPAAFGNALKTGGRMFVIVGSAPAMEGLLITRVDENTWETSSQFETVLPPLINAAEPEKFVF